MNTPTYLYLYANDAGGSAGNKVTYKNVQLLEGEYAWNVLGEDVEEVTVEAGEKENARSGILIPNKLTVGGKYTIAVDDIVNLKGEETEYTVLVRQNRESSIPISDTISISQNKKMLLLLLMTSIKMGIMKPYYMFMLDKLARLLATPFSSRISVFCKARQSFLLCRLIPLTSSHPHRISK